MLQRDYFIRIIEEFMAALQRFLEKDIDQRTDEDFRELYRQYVGDYSLLRNCSMEEAVDYARQQWEEDRRIQKLEMLAELWYAEGTCKMKPLRDLFLDKAFRLYDYIDAHSKEFSLSRKQKIRDIKSMLRQDGKWTADD
ncbi:hypothetical protein C7120_04620 [Prevotella sp. oral taxon 376]|uniref:hypothetical protein n=1 Tax=Prevotella sp. oral taxon 376 TaxID=712466 RepID=UPI000D1EA193|nr:hypothetical protein [Prevotella sp. oral taxon 376]PTL33877.1 hypothetical protein C7120_04620 [Prevotella sp. oral taxon 376]